MLLLPQITIFYSSRVKCGIVRMALVSRAFPDGTDDIGNPKFRYEPVPQALTDKITQPDPLTVAKLQGNVPVIGLNTLRAWNVAVHPVDGLV